MKEKASILGVKKVDSSKCKWRGCQKSMGTPSLGLTSRQRKGRVPIASLFVLLAIDRNTKLHVYMHAIVLLVGVALAGSYTTWIRSRIRAVGVRLQWLGKSMEIDIAARWEMVAANDAADSQSLFIATCAVLLLFSQNWWSGHIIRAGPSEIGKTHSWRCIAYMCWLASLCWRSPSPLSPPPSAKGRCVSTW